MASKWFEGLSAQSQGFLIATLLFRSKEHEAIFSFLDTSDAENLKERAASIMELERGQRVKLLIAELKRLLLTSSQPWLLAVDPSWIAEILKKEDRVMQRVALGALHKSLSKRVGEILEFPKDEITKMPELSAPVSMAIRRAIEKQLTPMRAVSFELELNASQLLNLTRSEFEILVLEAGKRGLAGAMSAVGVEKAAHLLEGLEKSAQSILIAELKIAKPFKWLDQDKSEKYLVEIFEVSRSPQEYFENCGLRLIAILLANEHQSVQKEIAQRLDFASGQKMLAYIKVVEPAPVDIFSLLIELAKDGKIDERFGKCLIPK